LLAPHEDDERHCPASTIVSMMHDFDEDIVKEEEAKCTIVL